MAVENLQVRTPAYDSNSYQAHTWPHVYARDSARVLNFNISSTVHISKLMDFYADDGIEAVPVFVFETWAGTGSGPGQEEPYDVTDDDDDEPDNYDRMLAREAARPRVGAASRRPAEYPSLTIVYDLPALNIRAWAMQGSSKLALVSFHLSSDADADLDTARKWLEARFPERKPVPGKVIIRFTFFDGYDSSSYDRQIAATSWAGIRSNYSKVAQPQLDSFTSVKPEQMRSGKIGILHGPPGTGKTHLIRALAQEWAPWASLRYIMDPEKFFTETKYMTDVVLKQSTPRQWNVLLCEDAEEFLVPDAKKKVGQALARLLNLSDGLIGQGLRLLILFTTNIDDSKLLPAITRPGRCFARVKIPLLTTDEANAWLAGAGKVTKPTALGDLYSMKDGADKQQIIRDDPENTHGQYL